MGAYLDSVPFSGIIRIRDMMYGVKDPYRLDQGDVSFDAPETVKAAMRQAIAENKTHYVQTTGVPRLRELLADKLRRTNRIPVNDADEIMVTNGGIHGVYMACQALLEPGDEVIVPDPEWPPCVGNILAARAVPVGCPLYESRDWRYDLDELESTITPRTRAIYVNSPNNPSGGVLTRADLERIASIASAHGLWIISDEAYEDVVYDDAEHVSIASLPGMYARTVPLYTFSKSYAMTGLRLGYVAVQDPTLRERMKKVLFYTASNIASIVQFGGIGGLEGPQQFIEQFRAELKARRDLFYQGIQDLGAGVFSGRPPKGAFYAFLRINPDVTARLDPGSVSAGLKAGPTQRVSNPESPIPNPQPRVDSLSWRLAEYLIEHARIGCVPGVDFGPHGEGYVRFCFARERNELTGALESMRALFGVTV